MNAYIEFSFQAFRKIRKFHNNMKFWMTGEMLDNNFDKYTCLTVNLPIDVFEGKYGKLLEHEHGCSSYIGEVYYDWKLRSEVVHLFNINL